MRFETYEGDNEMYQRGVVGQRGKCSVYQYVREVLEFGRLKTKCIIWYNLRIILGPYEGGLNNGIIRRGKDIVILPAISPISAIFWPVWAFFMCNMCFIYLSRTTAQCQNTRLICKTKINHNFAFGWTHRWTFLGGHFMKLGWTKPRFCGFLQYRKKPVFVP